MIKDQTILLLHGANSVGNEWANFENEFKKLGNKVVKPILDITVWVSMDRKN